MLERRLGAICRAVAVRVAESKVKGGKDATQQQPLKQAEAPAKTGQEAAESETVDISGLTSMALPPEMPIVIDEQAVEDILGVRARKGKIKVTAFHMSAPNHLELLPSG